MARFCSLLLFVAWTAACAGEAGGPPRAILSAAQLRGMPGGVIVLEASWGSSKANSRIPGAIPVDTDIFENGYPRWHLRPAEELHQAIGGLGIGPDSTVVVYSRQTIAAARVWWVLHYAGVRSVFLLDGGLEAWKRAGYAVESAARPTRKPPVARPFPAQVRREALAATSDVEHRGPKVVLADVRSAAEFNGERSGYSYLAAKGRIPGAIAAGDADVSARIYQNADGTLRKPAEIAEWWRQRGIRVNSGDGDELIFYCGSGWRSSLAYLYAFELGLTNIRNYSDGWSGWSTRYEAIPGFGGITPGWKQSPSGRPAASR